MVKIRLFRTGTTKRPMYRIVVMDSRRQRQGRVLEQIGTYDPRPTGGVHVNVDSLEQWVSKGAQLSATVNSLVKQARKQASAAPAEPAPAAS